MNARLTYIVPLPHREPLRLGARTLVMGILNITPDSFADGGVLFEDVDRAVDAGARMEAEGADIIDIGGESTRPGAERLSEKEELRRILPVVERLAKRIQIPISVDTYKARVARAALSELDRPILSGPSRKSFLKAAIGAREPSGREWGTAAAVTASVLLGAHIVRVHGVAAMVDVVRVADRVRDAAAANSRAANS